MTENSTNILFVEDDPNLGYLLKENFDSKGFHLDWQKDGVLGLAAFEKNRYDLCIFDVMLPNKDGFTLTREIRKKDENTPIILLTAKSMEHDVVEGFEIGADDYVTKPFSAQELLMRVKALLRRTARPQGGQQHYHIGKVNFDTVNRSFQVDEATQKLSTKENELLKLFFDNQNTLINKSKILTQIWGTDDYFTAKSLEVYITRLRKIIRPEPLLEIQNFHGTGYKLVVK